MPILTEKERRAILSPLSFSAKDRKAARFRAKIKIREILGDAEFLITAPRSPSSCWSKIREILGDAEFLLENHEAIRREFGVDVREICKDTGLERMPGDGIGPVKTTVRDDDDDDDGSSDFL